MPRYLIEVSEPDAVATKRISRSLSTLGSHFSTHADWRHKDGVTRGTLIVEAENEWGALRIVPPAMRTDAQIFRLKAKSARSRSAITTFGAPAPFHAIAA